MSATRRAWVLATIGATALIACGQKEVKPVVTIQKISPSGDSPLVAGATVVFEVEARVQGLKAGGTLGLIVQGSDGGLLGECAPIQASDGATTKLTAVAVIPQTASVRVFVPLYVTGSDRTDVMDMRDFKIVGKLGG